MRMWLCLVFLTVLGCSAAPLRSQEAIVQMDGQRELICIGLTQSTAPAHESPRRTIERLMQASDHLFRMCDPLSEFGILLIIRAARLVAYWHVCGDEASDVVQTLVTLSQIARNTSFELPVSVSELSGGVEDVLSACPNLHQNIGGTR